MTIYRPVIMYIAKYLPERSFKQILYRKMHAFLSSTQFTFKSYSYSMQRNGEDALEYFRIFMFRHQTWSPKYSGKEKTRKQILYEISVKSDCISL